LISVKIQPLISSTALRPCGREIVRKKPVVRTSCITLEKSSPNKSIVGFVVRLQALLYSGAIEGRSASLRRYNNSEEIKPRRVIASICRDTTVWKSRGVFISQPFKRSSIEVTMALEAVMRASCSIVTLLSAILELDRREFQIS